MLDSQALQSFLDQKGRPVQTQMCSRAPKPLPARQSPDYIRPASRGWFDRRRNRRDAHNATVTEPAGGASAAGAPMHDSSTDTTGTTPAGSSDEVPAKAPRSEAKRQILGFLDDFCEESADARREAYAGLWGRLEPLFGGAGLASPPAGYSGSVRENAAAALDTCFNTCTAGGAISQLFNRGTTRAQEVRERKARSFLRLSGVGDVSHASLRQFLFYYYYWGILHALNRGGHRMLI